jgi:hypothetical protein
VLDRELLDHLDRRRVRWCVIGGVALAAHGYARYTADVDLLTMETRVLGDAFWTGLAHAVEIRVGDGDDPIAGLVRWISTPPHDVLIGRGFAMQLAVDTAAWDPILTAPVATPAALVLLKLEAGAPHDLNDILALATAQAMLGGPDWRSIVEQHVDRLSTAARDAWRRVAADLPR